MLWGRWDSIIYPLTLNPDEAQAMANTLRMKAFGYSWNASDGTTVGPYNAIVLSWPYLFGWDVTFSTARLSAFILLTCIFIITFYTLKQACGRFIAVLFSLPLLIHNALTENFNFLHYSSETLPLFLLVIGNAIAISLYQNKYTFRINSFLVFLSGLVLGAAPFSKIQSGPIALFIGIFILYSIFKLTTDRKKILSLLFISSSLLPGLALLLPLVINNNLTDFYNSYIQWTFVYIYKTLPILDLYLLFSQEELFRAIINTLVVLSIIAVTLLFTTKKEIHNKNRILIIYSIAILIAVAFSITKSGMMILHYVTYLLPFFVFVPAYLSMPIIPTSHDKKYYLFFYIVIALIFILPPSVENFKIKKTIDSDYVPLLKSKFKWKNDNIFSWMSPTESDYYLIWGWMPQWYLLGNHIPATRETHTFAYADEHHLTPYFRQRFMKDIKNSPPDYVIDSITTESFFFKNRIEEGIHTFPAFNDYVKNNYVMLYNASSSQINCPIIYASKEKYAELKRKVVGFKNITASATEYIESIQTHFIANKLNDYSLTEDACVDGWLLPRGELGAVTIEFITEENVSEIIILNTGMGPELSRASKDVMITLYRKNKPVFSKKLQLFRHPKPTHVKLETPYQADKLKIEILSFEGESGGLNEVKVFRSVDKN